VIPNWLRELAAKRHGWKQQTPMAEIRRTGFNVRDFEYVIRSCVSNDGGFVQRGSDDIALREYLIATNVVEKSPMRLPPGNSALHSVCRLYEPPNCNQ
jgi:hypothetical protein